MRKKLLKCWLFSKQNSLKRFTFCAGNIRWFTTMIMWYDPRCPDFKILGEWWKMNPFAWYFLMARRDYLLLFFVGDFLMDSTMVSRHENNPTWGICLDLFPITQQANPQGMVVHPDDSLVFSFSKKKSAAEVELVSALRCPSKCGKKQGQVKANQGGGTFFFSEVEKMVFPGGILMREWSLNIFFLYSAWNLRSWPSKNHPKEWYLNPAQVMITHRFFSFRSFGEGLPKEKKRNLFWGTERMNCLWMKEFFIKCSWTRSSNWGLPWIWPLGDTGGIGCFFNLFQPSPILGKSQLTLVKNNMFALLGPGFFGWGCAMKEEETGSTLPGT